MPSQSEVLARRRADAGARASLGPAGGRAQVDLRVPDADYATALPLHRVEGPPRPALRGRARDLRAHHQRVGRLPRVRKGSSPPWVPISSRRFHALLGMSYVPPELREDLGEVRAALAGTLPGGPPAPPATSRGDRPQPRHPGATAGLSLEDTVARRRSAPGPPPSHSSPAISAAARLRRRPGQTRGPRAVRRSPGSRQPIPAVRLFQRHSRWTSSEDRSPGHSSDRRLLAELDVSHRLGARPSRAAGPGGDDRPSSAPCGPSCTDDARPIPITGPAPPEARARPRSDMPAVLERAARRAGVLPRGQRQPRPPSTSRPSTSRLALRAGAAAGGLGRRPQHRLCPAQRGAGAWLTPPASVRRPDVRRTRTRAGPTSSSAAIRRRRSGARAG